MKRLSMLLMFVLPMAMASHHAQAQEVTITLNPGWTWVSYPRADTLDVTTALQSIPPTEGDVIKSQTFFATYMNGMWLGNLQQLIPGKGLMYKSMNTETVSFVFGAELSVPIGAIDGLFSVSDSTQVYFSRGNLQYRASTNTWRFAENQWDYVGDGNTHASPNYDGWIDLFAWGTSGYDHGATCYHPWSNSTTHSDYYAYGVWNANLYDQTGQADWGYNAISNGGNRENQWRTMTIDEWNYVFFTRNTESGIRFARSVVNGVFGIVVLPDDWNSATYYLTGCNSIGTNNNDNTISVSDWNEILEPSGAVFLPGAGRISFSEGWVDNAGYICDYWSSTHYNEECAYFIDWYVFGAFVPSSSPRGTGRSVRVVRSQH